MQLRNTNVLITGGSRGLGLALGKALARAGARVILVARHADTLAQAVDLVKAAAAADGHPHEVAVHGIQADIGAKSDIYRIAGQAGALLGPIDILIHNASILGATPMPLLLDTACEDLERVLQVNLIGPFRLSKALAGSMAVRGQGVIVHVSSDAATSAYPNWGPYGASKAALDHMSQTWAAELDGVRVFSVDPGEMDTEMHAQALPDADRTRLTHPDEVAARVVAMIANPERAPSGARLEASAWSLPAPAGDSVARAQDFDLAVRS